MEYSAHEINASFAYCRNLAKAQGKNFYYSFLVLPKAKRDAMCAIYSFMRYCDDAVDEPGDAASKQAALQRCRGEFDALIQHTKSSHPILPALQFVITKYQIPTVYFEELLKGMEMDLTMNRYSHFEDLYSYCYRAAGVVGLVTIHVFEFENPKAIQLAEYCGIAFQLTNILRDIQEDIERDRIYLPEEEMQQFGINATLLRDGQITPEMTSFMQFQVNRAKDYYQKAKPLLPLIHKDAQPCLVAMMEIYGNLLLEIEKRRYDVFQERVRLSTSRKLRIGLQAWVSPRLRSF